MRHLWQAWVPRIEDYWESFSAPYRATVTDLVDKATPPGGSVIDFGCGAGVQTFLLRQRRPDILIYAVDCNPQARTLTRTLCGADERILVQNTWAYAERLPTVDTFLSIFACTYLEPEEVGVHMQAFQEHAETLIFCEPTYLEDPPAIQPYEALPARGYRYPYGSWFQTAGAKVETLILDPPDFLNAVTIVTKETP